MTIIQPSLKIILTSKIGAGVWSAAEVWIFRSGEHFLIRNMAENVFNNVHFWVRQKWSPCQKCFSHQPLSNILINICDPNTS